MEWFVCAEMDDTDSGVLEPAAEINECVFGAWK